MLHRAKLNVTKRASAQGPDPRGCRYTTLDTGEPYYHNHVTGETVWDKPPEWR